MTPNEYRAALVDYSTDELEVILPQLLDQWKIEAFRAELSHRIQRRMDWLAVDGGAICGAVPIGRHEVCGLPSGHTGRHLNVSLFAGVKFYWSDGDTKAP